MNLEDVIYLSLLIISIFFGHIFHSLGDKKQWISTLLGLFITTFASGYHVIYPIIGTLINIIILKVILKRYIHIVSFISLFSFLLFFRLSHYVGLSIAPSHTNAIQMVLTLKLVGLCFEIHDTWKKREDLKNSTNEEVKQKLQLELKYEEIDPTAIDVFHYAFCYIGVLTGPYYKYRVYNDMLENKVEIGPDCLRATLQRIRYVPMYACLFLISGYYFPLSFAESPEIFNHRSFLYRVLYMTPIFFNFRMRIYSGFALSECVCINAGLGAYPIAAKSKPGKGPTIYEALEKKSASGQVYDFETVHNIDEYGSEFTPTVRTGMKCWNMTVQYWLATNVYRRLRFSRPIKEALTMLVSAFWHGVYSGYYLSMLTVPFILAVEDFYDRILRRKLSEQNQRIYDWFSWVLKMQHFSYMGMAFLLLRIDATIHYWRSIGFLYHSVIVILHAIAQYVNLISAKVEKKLEKSRNTAKIGDSNIRFQKVKEETKKDK